MNSLTRAIALLGLCCTLSGCAWLMGHDQLPERPAPFHVEATTVEARSGGLTVKGTWLGEGELVVTGRNLVGRIGRAANPYGDDTLVFQIEIENGGQDPIVVLPDKSTLTIDGAAPRVNRTLADYRKRWPSWAVTTAEEGEDQAAAYKHVVDTILIERLVRPGQTAEGRMAFPRAVAKSEMVLRLPYQVGFRKQHLELTWRIK